MGDILAYAWRNGITLLDTATLYGFNEKVIGRTIPPHASFKIVTKTPIFQETKINKKDAARLKDEIKEMVLR